LSTEYLENSKPHERKNYNLGRLVTKGYTHTYCINYEETLVKINIVWILLFLAAHFGGNYNSLMPKMCYCTET